MLAAKVSASAWRAWSPAAAAPRAFCFWVYAYPAFLMYAAHSSGRYWARICALAWQTGSWLRAPAFRSRVLNLANMCSIGLRSSDYFGKKTRRAPTSRTVRRAAFPCASREIVYDAAIQGRKNAAVAVDRHVALR